MLIDSNRITDPQSISPVALAEAAKTRDRLVVQFSRADAYAPQLLAGLNEACRLAGARIQVRFYGHYGSKFDASTLRHLPDLRDLAVDCLSHIANEGEIGRLPRLQGLSFGVFELDRPDFLHSLNLAHLKRLTLTATRKRNIDLAPLVQCQNLTDQFVTAHAKGIASVAGLPMLRKLTLSAFPKSSGLEFIASVPALAQLTLVLGGRTHLDDVVCATVEMLQVLRVRGVRSLGDLSRLPALAALRVEDQIQITELDLSGANLERFRLDNCKNLSVLRGLEKQSRLREFSASRVALDMDALRDRDWPPTVTSVQLLARARKWNDLARAELAAKGLGAKPGYWR